MTIKEEIERLAKETAEIKRINDELRNELLLIEAERIVKDA